MFKNLTKLTIIIALLALLIPTAAVVLAAPPFQEAVACDEDYTVQADDWLSKLADKFYGDILAYPAIFEATNAAAATDSSYATIVNADLIEPGWKLCIPSLEDAQALLGATPSLPTPIPTLTSPEEGVKQLIAQLRSNDEDVSKAASVQLTVMGDNLSEEQVLEIVQVMRTDSVEWQRFLRRGTHCTYYEVTTTQYYAADALLNMRSIYVSDEIITEARDALASGIYTRKVDDPGWI